MLLLLINKWLEYQASRNRPNTLRSAKRVAGLLIDRFGHLPIEQFDLAAFINSRNVRPTSINCELRTIKSFLNWCVENEYLDKAPRIKMLKTSRKREVEVITEKEYRALLLASDHKPECQIIIKIMADTGMRLGEVVYLQWGDIHFENCIIHIRNKPEVNWYTKSHQNRTIPISSELALELSRMRGEPSDWVVPYSDANSAAGGLRRVFKAAGVYSKFRLSHAVRHTYCTRALQAGANLSSVQYNMGHENPDTTLLYDHPDIESCRDAAKKGRLA